MSKSPRRRPQLFVLAPAEKRVIAFVVAAFVLGVLTLRYRAAHPAGRPNAKVAATGVATRNNVASNGAEKRPAARAARRNATAVEASAGEESE